MPSGCEVSPDGGVSVLPADSSQKKSYQGKTNKAASSSLGQKFTVTNLRSTIVMKLLLDRMVMKVGLIGVALELSRWNSKRHP